MSIPHNIKKLQEKDKKLKGWLTKGGRDGAKPALLELIRRAVKPSRP